MIAQTRNSDYGPATVIAVHANFDQVHQLHRDLCNLSPFTEYLLCRQTYLIGKLVVFEAEDNNLLEVKKPLKGLSVRGAAREPMIMWLWCFRMDFVSIIIIGMPVPMGWYLISFI